MRVHGVRKAIVAWLLVVLAGCAGSGDGARGGPPRTDPPEFAIAIHGGAGTIRETIEAAERDAYLASLDEALRLGVSILREGGSSLEAVERVIRLMEDDERFNAGRGAVFNEDAGHELDASIMRGDTLACGAVAAVRTVKNPISLARLVMENTPHVLLSGPGADQFAVESGVEIVEQDYFFTESRRRRLEDARAAARKPVGGGTVGVVALDRRGDLAAGTSTGGLTNKRVGRVGDSPIIGAGTYADNRTCAVSATGKGEQFIRHAVAHSISSHIALGGLGLSAATRRVVHEVLDEGDGGVIALAPDGTISMEFNTPSMLRGAADSRGRFETRIW